MEIATAWEWCLLATAIVRKVKLGVGRGGTMNVVGRVEGRWICELHVSLYGADHGEDG